MESVVLNHGEFQMDELIKDIEAMGDGDTWTWDQRDKFQAKYQKTFMKTLGDLK